MSAPTVEDLKKAIAQLPIDEKRTLATWLNAAVIREEMHAAKNGKSGIKWVTVRGAPSKDLDLGNREHMMERLLRERTAR